MSARRTAGLLAALMAVSITLGACGSQNNKSTTPNPNALAAQVASYDLSAGESQRFIVGLFTANRRFVSFGKITVRFASLGKGPSKKGKFGPPMTATFLTIPDPGVKVLDGPVIVSPSKGKGVYGADVKFDRPGFWQVRVSAKLSGKLQTAETTFEVFDKHRAVAIGESAPLTDNPTLDTPGVPQSAIDSRASAELAKDVPDPDLHRSSIKAAIEAKRPVVISFSTPAFCVSKFCGPVTDMVGDLQKSYGDRATFIHIEVWKDFNQKELSEATTEWLDRDGDGDLQEPWTYVVGADGLVTHRWDNVTTREELEPVLKELPVAKK